jgi:hypothetical protein
VREGANISCKLSDTSIRDETTEAKNTILDTIQLFQLSSASICPIFFSDN